MPTVLIADRLPEAAAAALAAEPGLTVIDRPGLSDAALAQALAEADGLIVRSATRVTAGLLEKAPRLTAIVRAGAGVDTIDLPAATKRGIVVMNTPGGNTVSTAELALALLLAAARRIPQAHASLMAGHWDRSSLTGIQLAGKTLGVVGLGRVGQEVAKRALALGMTVVGYDPYVSDGVFEQLTVERAADLKALLRRADAVTLHTPLTAETQRLIGAAELAEMKPGAILVNAARGGIVDEAALAAALASERLAAAAVDVFEREPPRESPLLGAPHLVATPHLGASTLEAETQVALDAARQMADALLRRRVRNAVNLPALDAQAAALLAPYLDLASRLGAVAVQLFDGPWRKVELTVAGELARHDVRTVTAGFLVGVFRRVLAERVNLVNAPVLAAERGLTIDEVKSAAFTDYVNLVTARVESPSGARRLAGTIYGRREPRLVDLDGCRLEVRPAGEMLFISNDDRPGVIGAIGTVFARHGINIADMTVGRLSPGGRAVTVLNLDSPPGDAALAELARAEHIRSLRRASLPPPTEGDPTALFA